LDGEQRHEPAGGEDDERNHDQASQSRAEDPEASDPDGETQDTERERDGPDQQHGKEPRLPWAASASLPATTAASGANSIPGSSEYSVLPITTSGSPRAVHEYVRLRLQVGE